MSTNFKLESAATALKNAEGLINDEGSSLVLITGGCFIEVYLSLIRTQDLVLATRMQLFDEFARSSAPRTKLSYSSRGSLSWLLPLR